jgi:hypothetical protein
MALNINTTEQAKAYLDLYEQLKDIKDSGVVVFVDLRNLNINLNQSREFATTLDVAIVTLEKSLFIWLKGIDVTYATVNALGLSFSDAELIGF